MGNGIYRQKRIKALRLFPLEFPYATGKAHLEPVEGVSVAFCSYIDLPVGTFTEIPQDPVNVLLTVAWKHNHSEPVLPHDATAAWSEDVSM